MKVQWQVSEFAREMVADDEMDILRFQNEAKKKDDPVADFAKADGCDATMTFDR